MFLSTSGNSPLTSCHHIQNRSYINQNDNFRARIINELSEILDLSDGHVRDDTFDGILSLVRILRVKTSP